MGVKIDKAPGNGPIRVFIYSLICLIVRTWFRLVHSARVFGVENVPATGPLLVAANHQSYYDPPIVSSFVTHRHLDFIAKAGLFRFKPFAWLISFLNSVPIREDQGDTAAIKETIRRLEKGRAVLIFPEGSRSPDGAMHEFKRGVALLVKKARCPVVPVAVEGVYDVWPRGRSLPRLFRGPLYVKYGKPLAYDELMKDGADSALAKVRGEVLRLRLELRAEMRRASNGKWPAHGDADEADAGGSLPGQR